MATATTATKQKASVKKETPEASVNIQLDESKQKELSKQVVSIQCQVNTIVVKDQDTYNEAAALLVTIKQYAKETEAKYFKGPYAAIKTLKKHLDDLWARLITPAEVMEDTIKRKMEGWVLAERRRVQEEAREKQRLENIEAEKKKKALERQAVNAESKGKDEVAEQKREQAAAISPVQVVAEKAVETSGTGTAVKSDFDVEITDIRAFLKLCCDDINVNMKELVTVKVPETKKTVTRYRDMGQEVPGTKIVERARISA